MTLSAEISFRAHGSGGQPDADALALALLCGNVDPSTVLTNAIHAIKTMNSLDIPAPDAGVLISALLATAPDAVTPELVGALRSVVMSGDLARTRQPALDESFQLLSLLVATDLTAPVAKVATELLSVEGLHPRWARKAIGLLLRATDLRPESIDLSSLIVAADRLERPEIHALNSLVISPTLLATPSAVNVALLQQLEKLVGGDNQLRYLLATLKDDACAPSDVRDYAREAVRGAFPLVEPIRQRLKGKATRILCIQNIADGQGDEIVRVVPLLQALLDAYPDASAVVVTDRGYLYRHSRVTTISFDEPDRIQAALGGHIDVLLEFFDDEQPQLNHDPRLPYAVRAMRDGRQPAIDIAQAKRWNEFVFTRVLINGMDWAHAITVDRPLEPSVYDPVMRLIAELGMPIRVGEQAPAGEWLLSGRETPDLESEWTRLTSASAGRPIALLNPFGGNARLKGFTPSSFPDLVRLIRALIAEDYDVVMAPSGQPWGTSMTCGEVLQMLDEPERQRVRVVDDSVSPTAFIHRLLSFVKRADLVVTVEGWMMHADYLAGRPYRLLTLPASDPRTWQPWGRSANQRPWIFAGAHVPEQSPLPEQPRKRAWLELLQRVSEPRWGPMLTKIVRSEDPDLRRLAISAMGRCRTSDARELASWLGDPSHRVRASAAQTLLQYHRNALGKAPVPDASWLEAVRLMGETRPQWKDVIDIGEGALPALETLLHIEDPVTRREAAMCIETIRRSMVRAIQVGEANVTGANRESSTAERERSA